MRRDLFRVSGQPELQRLSQKKESYHVLYFMYMVYRQMMEKENGTKLLSFDLKLLNP